MSELAEKLDAFEAVLAPLIDVALWSGISVNDVQRVLRRAFIDRAASQLRQKGSPVSVARVAVAAGTNRSEVWAVLKDSGSRESARTSGARLRARIPELLSVWTNDPKFSGPYGAVRNLFVGEASPNREQENLFSDLTKAVDPQIDPREAAEMLVQAGCASWVDSSCQVLRFDKVTYIPGQELAADQHFNHGMRILAGMAGTVARNLDPSAGTERLVQRAVIADHPLAPAEAAILLEYAETNFGAALSQADQFIGALPPAVGQRGRRYGIGVFVFEDQPLSGAGTAATWATSEFAPAVSM